MVGAIREGVREWDAQFDSVRARVVQSGKDFEHGLRRGIPGGHIRDKAGLAPSRQGPQTWFGCDLA
jgi:hypothetical protein